MLFQSRNTAGVYKAATLNGMQTLITNALLVGALELPATLLYAQEQSVNFDLLVFDAVPLSVQSPADESSGPSAAVPLQAAELGSLPRNNPQPVQTLVRTHANPVTASAPVDLSSADATRYEALLKEVEQKGNAYDAGLSESLMDLAAAYERSGDYARALPLYERASHLTRVNYGLFSAEQIPIVERVIDNQVMRGDLIAADQQQEYLYYLHRRIHGENNPGLLPAMEAYAEWNLFAFSARKLSPTPVSADEIASETPSATKGPAPVEDVVMFRIQRLMNAQGIYQQIVKLLLTHFGTADPRLPEVERSLAVTNYLYATQVVVNESLLINTQSLNYNPDFPVKMLGFAEGREALERRIQYLEETPGTPRDEITKAKMELGDWLMSSRKRMNGIEVYDQVFADYVAAGASQTEIDALFHPALPVAIPTFLVSPYSRESLNIPADASLQYKGYVDVEFVVGRYGQTSTPRELARSEGTPDRLVDALLRNIRRDQYRPRYRDGRAVEQDRIRARYYYAY